QRLRVRNRATSTEETLDTETLYVLIGADPHTDWLPDTVARDDHGFVVTGWDLDRAHGPWALDRPPLPFETSLPGVFAIGDVRGGSSKRLRTRVAGGGAR